MIEQDKQKASDCSDGVRAKTTTVDLLWKVIGRYDAYVISTNSKASAVVAYNSIVIAGVILKYQDVLALFNGHPKCQHFVGFALVLSTIGAFISVFLTFIVVLPYMWSPAASHSVLFYSDVAKTDSGEQYLSTVERKDEHDLLIDLASQTRAVAIGATRKFRWMRFGILAILCVQFPALAAVFLAKLLLLL